MEDSRTEAKLLARTLGQGGHFELEWQRVGSRDELRDALDAGGWEIILCDYALPGYNALDALELIRQRAPGVPVMVVTGAVGEEAAVECMRAGARDLLLKDRLHRLVPAVQRELMQARVRRERQLAEEALQTCQRFLVIANQQTSLSGLLEEWIGALAEATPLSAVGLRLLSSDGGIDYQTHRGFSDSFLLEEGPLSLDHHHCFCSRIIRGEASTLPMQPTPHGSGWTGDLTEVVAKNRTDGMRCGCVDAGFRSLVLVPIHTGGPPVGLFLLADPRPQMVNEELVSLLEILAVQFGAALARARALAETGDREHLYRTLVELSPDAVFVTDPKSRVVTANRRAAQMYGLDEPAQLMGVTLDELMPASQPGQPPEPGLHPRDLGGGAVERLQRRRDGTTFPGEVYTAELKYDEESLGTVLSVRDISQRHELQAQLAQADRLASVGMLTAGVAHEINNPLTYVLQNLDWMMDGLDELPRLPPGASPDGAPTDLGQLARDAMDGVNRVRKIMRDLRTFSRVEKYSPLPVLITDVLEVAATMATVEIKRRARLVKRLEEVPLVLADDGRLAQVFLNLLINAAQAVKGPVHENEIELYSRAEGDEVLVSVKDTGPGIPPEHLERLFTPFFTTKAPGVGSGLGLAICQDLVRRFQGRIEVQSEVGRGSTFTVRLPAMDRKAASGGLVRTSTGSLVRGGPRGRVLIVDDEPCILTSLKRLLGRKHEVQTAGCGEEAREALSQDRQFDVILCDIMMPRGTGKDLYQWLRDDDPRLAARMVFITGGSCAPWAEQFIKEVPNTIMHKPLDTPKLIEMVDKMVARDDV